MSLGVGFVGFSLAYTCLLVFDFWLFYACFYLLVCVLVLVVWLVLCFDIELCCCGLGLINSRWVLTLSVYTLL